MNKGHRLWVCSGIGRCVIYRRFESTYCLHLKVLIETPIINKLILTVRHNMNKSMEERKGVHGVLVGKPEGKRPLGRPRRRWEDNIKMDLEEVGRDCGDWMELAQDRDSWRALVSTVMNFRVVP